MNLNGITKAARQIAQEAQAKGEPVADAMVSRLGSSKYTLAIAAVGILAALCLVVIF